MIKIVLKRVQYAKVKFYRDGEESREALGMENCSIIIWDELELELAWSKKATHVLKTVFQYSYYLVFWINRFLRRVMFYVEQNSK